MYISLCHACMHKWDESIGPFVSVCVSVIDFLGSYNDSGQFRSHLSTLSSENTKLTTFLCLVDGNASSSLHFIKDCNKSLHHLR